jgi:hypothetical protein
VSLVDKSNFYWLRLKKATILMSGKIDDTLRVPTGGNPNQMLE